MLITLTLFYHILLWDKMQGLLNSRTEILSTFSEIQGLFETGQTFIA